MMKSRARALRAVKAMLYHREITALGCPRTKATLLTARKYHLSEASVSRYRGKIKGVPQRSWMQVLWPGHKGRTKRAPMTREAWKALLASYLRPERVARREFRRCVEQLRAVAKVRGWHVPSNRTLQRRIVEFLAHRRRGRKRNRKSPSPRN